MVRTRPILFSSSMVRALLEGRKTQTRRVVTHQPVTKPAFRCVSGKGWAWESGDRQVRCPYGTPADLLWVRETWRLWEGAAFSTMSGDPLDPDIIVGPLSGLNRGFLRTRPIEYRADTNSEGPWRPAIHMPRWASRVTLRLTSVAVERLQDISANDAKAEGLDWVGDGGARYGLKGYPATWHDDPRSSFAVLWDSINSRRGFGFDTNPWVWALRFDVIPRNVDEINEAPAMRGHERTAQAAVL